MTTQQNKCDRKQLCGYLKKIFIEGGEDKVNNYNDYLSKELNKKRNSVERSLELQDQKTVVTWWKEHVMKHYNREALKAEKVKKENDRINNIANYFAKKIIGGEMSLEDIKSEAMRDITNDILNDTPFYVDNKEQTVIADRVIEPVAEERLPEEIKNKEEVMTPTLEELLEKYGVGARIYDSDRRFYTGSNNNDERWQQILNKYDPERKHPRHSSLGKYIKDIIKKELGVVVSARFKWATHTPELNIYIKGKRSEISKSWDELTEAEKRDFAYKLLDNSFHWIWYGVSSLPKEEDLYPVAKRYYETFTLHEKYLKGNYRIAHDFAKEIMDSFQYDHTGINMGDCDYIDCDFFDFVYIELTDRAEVEDINKLYNEITNWMTAQAKLCKEEDIRRREEYMKRQGAAA